MSSSRASPFSLRFTLLLALLGVAACSGQVASESSGQSTSTEGTGTGGATSSSSASSSSNSTGSGNSTHATGSSGSASSSASGGDGGVADGKPVRNACTGDFGMGLTATHGRMDGYLVSILPPGGSTVCNGDDSHVHLQVEIHGAVYDVAVNVDTLYDAIDMSLPDGAWSEGWHPGFQLDYPTTLGVHAASFTTTTPAALAQWIETQLATVNHISVFATGYGPTGAHDVHREGTGVDGAIATEPLSPKAHLLLFRFSTDSF